MSPKVLENLLRDLPQHGTLVKRRPYRQVWRFEFNGKGFYLKFYPRGGGLLKRLVAGNPAQREFDRLMALQKAGVAAPVAIAVLGGFRLAGEGGEEVVGDAVIMTAVEPAVSLDEIYRQAAMEGERVAGHRGYVGQVIELCQKLAKARLGHRDLHLGNLLLKDGKLHLIDGYAVERRPLNMRDLYQLQHSTASFMTRADLWRGWLALADAGRLPAGNPVSRRRWRKLVERSTEVNDYFARFEKDGWRCHAFLASSAPRRWSPVSGWTVTQEQWREAVGRISELVAADQMTVLKRSASGDVLSGTILLGGRPLDVVVKRPKRRYWYRYLNEIGRGSRSRRAWRKAWELVARGIPTAWPLLLAERRVGGYVVDQMIVFEHIAGPTLAQVDLDGLSAVERANLFRRAGRSLRKIEESRYTHFDAKSSNWIVRMDEKTGPVPLLVDVDGVRFYPWDTEGVRRLLRSMKEHEQYTPADSRELCLGYAPFAAIGGEFAADEA